MAASMKSLRLAAARERAKIEADPEAMKVREWRLKLQIFLRFLSSNKVLLDDEMPAMDALFTTVEGYRNMTVEYLQYSKISKVMRHIHRLDAINVPRDEEFHFRDRAQALVDKWNELLNSNSPVDAKGGEDGEAVIADMARMNLNGTAEV
ncbi:hypothetical protein B0H12DRAFT_1241466 [Mycena haematopus]|nr:hypothetical protein B0H12DRAFT_1241466 [Mycena haematopus]